MLCRGTMVTEFNTDISAGESTLANPPSGGIERWTREVNVLPMRIELERTYPWGPDNTPNLTV